MPSTAAMDKRTAMQDIRPNGNPEDVLRASRILVSKNWQLPPRVAPVRPAKGPAKGKGKGKVQKGDEKEGRSHKQLQNREAQRAYRERRANRLKEMEESIEALQRLVAHWKGKCAEKDRQIALLRGGIPPEASASGGDTSLGSTPMGDKNCPGDKDSPDASSPGGNSAPATCGFCNEDTNCVCTELEHAQDSSAPPPVAAPAKSTVFSCSGAPETCSKCADIDESCIKPAAPDLLQQGNSHQPIEMVESDKPLEIDFTHLAGKERPSKIVGKGAVPWSRAQGPRSK